MGQPQYEGFCYRTYNGTTTVRNWKRLGYKRTMGQPQYVEMGVLIRVSTKKKAGCVFGMFGKATSNKARHMSV
jgi:hypothetical protein